MEKERVNSMTTDWRVFGIGLALIAIPLLAIAPLMAPDSAFAQCAEFDSPDNEIVVTCDVTFSEVEDEIDDSDLIEDDGDGEFILNVDLIVRNGATLSITSSDLDYLKIADANGIIVYGTIEIDGIKATSWDSSDDEVIEQDEEGSIPRAYLNLRASEDGFIRDSEFGHMGYNDPGRRGVDLFGVGPSSGFEITDSEFHNMWFAFYSNSANDILIDGSEYYDNIKYAIDPHTGTNDMEITNNHIHDNPIGIICSDNCSEILIEGNEVHDVEAGIFFSRNMHDSIARDNLVYNAETGILVSESPDNQIYDNEVTDTDTGIYLFNPTDPDDGFTENNEVYENAVTDSTNGVVAKRSADNIVRDNNFDDIETSEFVLNEDSGMEIHEQEFEDTQVQGMRGENVVQIRDSGDIEVDGSDADGDDFEQTLEGETITIDSE